MIFLRVFKHLLPNARAWRLTVEKQLRHFFEGMAETPQAVKAFLDGVWSDIFPETTRELSAWEQQFGLQNTGLTESERRDRLAATWKALGGQSPKYIQDTLRNRGFDVYVHEWWVPGTEAAIGVHAAATPRNPLFHMNPDYTVSRIFVDCGEPLAQCGEDFAQAGNYLTPDGYPLVNKVLESTPDILPLCGEPLAQCGEPTAQAGYFVGYRDGIRRYIVPTDPKYWPYFLYIGGENFGDLATVPASRRDEFEALCLKICPTQLWLGILVTYS